MKSAAWERKLHVSLVRHRDRFRRRRSYLGHYENSAGTLSASRDRACCWTISWAADTELWGLLCQRGCPAGVCSRETGSVRPHCAQISDWPRSWFSYSIPGPHLVGIQLTSAGCLPPTLLDPTGHADIPVTPAHGAFCTNGHCAHGSMSVSWVTVTNAWLRPVTVSALKGCPNMEDSQCPVASEGKQKHAHRLPCPGGSHCSEGHLSWSPVVGARKADVV